MTGVRPPQYGPIEDWAKSRTTIGCSSTDIDEVYALNRLYRIRNSNGDLMKKDEAEDRDDTRARAKTERDCVNHRRNDWQAWGQSNARIDDTWFPMASGWTSRETLDCLA